MTNLWLEICSYINKKNSGDIISRKELTDYLSNIGMLGIYTDGKIYRRSLDVYRRYLTKAEYLEDTKNKGCYKVLNNIPTTLSMNKIRKQAYNYGNFN